MKDYKTTTAGLIAAIAAFILSNSEQFDPRVTAIAQLVETFGLLFLGVFASDASLPKAR